MPPTRAHLQIILVAGPYRSNTNDDRSKIAENMRRMNEAALEVFRRGHVPVTGEALALPLIEMAGSVSVGDGVFNQIFHPLARRLASRVDAVLRIGGPSVGADEMVGLVKAAGGRVYSNISEITPL
jgi:hypothetical protein